MKVLSSECMHNTRLLTLISLTFYVKLTSTAHPGSSYGDNVVFMYEEKSAQFKPSCKCHIEGTETSHFHKWFKLEEDGPMYDLCYAGSYVAEITPTKAVCKPCITGTYNPSSNACSYCLMCRTCGEFENEATGCSSTVNRICECKLGESCHPYNATTTPANVHTSTNETKQSPPHTPSSTSYQQTLSSNPQTTGTVTTLPSNENSTCPPCECEIETKWMQIFIVLLVVFSIIILSLVILIVVLLKSSRTEYQGVPIQEIPLEILHIADHQEECNGSLVEIPPLTEDNKKTIADKSLSDHVIELLVKEIGKDYRTIGIALGLTPAKLDRIEMDNKNQNIINAFRNMLLAARQMHSPNKQCEVFIKAFQDCNRRDLADIIIKNVATESGRVDLAIADPENGTDKCLKYPTEEADERRSTTSSSHSCS